MFSTPLLRGLVCPIFLFLSETLKRLRGSAEIQPLCSDLRSEATVLPIFLKFHGVCFVPYCLLHISCVLTTLQLTFGWNLPAEVRLTISHRRAGRALQEHSVQTPSRLGLKGICDC